LYKSFSGKFGQVRGTLKAFPAPMEGHTIKWLPLGSPDLYTPLISMNVWITLLGKPSRKFLRVSDHFY